jgi:hypothetical protein
MHGEDADDSSRNLDFLIALAASLANVLNVQINLECSSAVIIVLQSIAGFNYRFTFTKVGSFRGAFPAIYLAEQLEAKTFSIPQEKAVVKKEL